MKVILLQDVAKIGKRFEEATVPDGYALNMLIPKGMAEVANPENRKKIAARKAKQVAQQADGDAAFTEAVQTLSATPLVIKAEANDQGHLFEAVKAETIAEAAKAAGHTLTAEQINIAEPIKSLGEHGVTLRSGEATMVVTVMIEAA